MLRICRTNMSDYMSGSLFDGKKFICNTLELPWNDNKVRASCIPDGEYRIAVVQSAKFGHCVHILGVSGRSGILIHAGNSLNDTKGCILVGLSACQDGSHLIASKQTLRRLIKVINNTHRFIKIETL